MNKTPQNFHIEGGIKDLRLETYLFLYENSQTGAPVFELMFTNYFLQDALLWFGKNMKPLSIGTFSGEIILLVGLKIEKNFRPDALLLGIKMSLRKTPN